MSTRSTMAFAASIVMLSTVSVPATPNAEQSQAVAAQNREYQIKAAFLYNFARFAEWPEEPRKDPDKKAPFVIGVVDSTDFATHFDALRRKRVRNRPVVVRYFQSVETPKESDSQGDAEWNKTIKALKECDLLMFCRHSPTSEGAEEVERTEKIVKALAGSPVLTVGETPGFLENGGNINFVRQDNRIRFEVNLSSAHKNDVKVQSKLLRLAKRVIAEDKGKDSKR